MTEHEADPCTLFAEVGLQFDHVAIAAPRLRDLLPLYRDALGGILVLGADNPEVGWRCLRLRLESGAVMELMEPLRGSTFLDSFFERTGGGGLHHLTFLADDLPLAAKLLRDKGYEPIRDPDPDAAYQELFLHPRTTGGVLLQVQKRMPGPAGPPPHTVEDILAGHGWNGTGVPSP